MTKIEYIGKCLLVGVSGKNILVIGDMHLGYEEALNETGVLVNRGSFRFVLSYLDRVFDRMKVEGKRVDEVIFMGDVKHVFGGVLKQERGDVIRLINYLFEKITNDGKIIIIKGNHDAILEPILKGKEKVELKDSYSIKGACFVHGDKDKEEIWKKGIDIVVMGHVHPAIRLNDGVKNEKYKCFLIGEIKNRKGIGAKKRKLVVVPSFSDYNEGIDLLQNEIDLPWKVNLKEFRVKVVSDSLEALDFGKLGEIN